MEAVIEFVADTAGLKPAADQLKALGQLTDAQYQAFTKANQQATASAKARIQFEKELDKATQQNIADAKKMNDQFRQMTAVIAGEVIKETVVALQEVAQEIEQIEEKAKPAKQELRELMAALNSGELSGEELAQAKFRAAELTDTIADTRDEIRQMSSDTRRLDLVVEGVTTITSAFALAQGAVALFGDESEDLQKTLLKVQAATAVATGAQQLYETATRKGGIAALVYGNAIKVVEAIQKQFAISSAAAWAAATAGLSVLITGVGLLISYLTTADDTMDEIAKKRFEEQQAQEKERLKQREEFLAGLSDVDKQFFEDQERERKQRLAAGQNEDQVEFDLLSKSIERFTNKKKAYLEGYYDYLGLTFEEEKKRIQSFDDYINEAIYRRSRIWNEAEKKRADDQLKAFDDNKRKFVESVKQFISGVQAAIRDEKDPIIEQMKQTGQEMSEAITEAFKKTPISDKVVEVPFKPTIRKKDAEDFAVEFEEAIKAVAAQAIALARQTTDAIFQIINENRQYEVDKQLQKLEEQKNNEIKNKELTEAQKTAIENKYAVEVTKIKRKQFEAEKQNKIAQAFINGALAATTLMTQTPPPNPAYFAGLGIIIGQTALEVALISNQKFSGYEKGGKNIPEGMALVGEKGPELMWIPGGSSVVPANDTQELLKKWGIPTGANFTPEQLNSEYTTAPLQGHLIDYNKLAKALGEELRNTPKVSVTMDKNGFNYYVTQKNRTMHLYNKKYDA